MNRQIKFRGRPNAIDEWFYGDLEYNQRTKVARIHTYDANGEYATQCVVNPATVGQFTGLLDCNGKEIYEGDIVRIAIEPTFETAETNNRNADLMGIEMPSWVNGGDIIARVSYFDCAFHFIHLQSYLPQCGEHVQEPMLNYLCHERHPEMHKSYDQTIEVIGNVFDNPELLTDKLNKQ